MASRAWSRPLVFALAAASLARAALLAGLAGWLHAHYLRFVSPHAFGVNAGYGDKTVSLNGIAVGKLPTGGDDWKAFGFALTVETRAKLTLRNIAQVSVPLNEDEFKVRNLRLVLTLADGRVAKVGPKAAFTSHADWAHFEGKVFDVDAPAKVRRSPPIPLDLE